jgi:hypothetical protein
MLAAIMTGDLLMPAFLQKAPVQHVLLRGIQTMFKLCSGHWHEGPAYARQ